MRKLATLSYASLVSIVLICASILSVEGSVLLVRQDGSGQFETIGPAVESAASGDTILVGPGTYTGEQNRGIEVTGTSLCFMTEQGPDSTIIDCEKENRFLNILDCPSGVTEISGFRIINGYTFNELRFSGGGINAESCSLIVKEVEFLGNLSAGGALGIADAVAVVDNCSFVDNLVYLDGGGIWVTHSDVVLQGLTMSGNNASSGGGVYIRNSTAVIDFCICIGNSASNNGGGIAFEYCDRVTITNAVIQENETSNLYGGGIFAGTSVASISGSLIERNASGSSGGGVYSLGCDSLSIDECVFDSNYAETGSGAIRLHSYASSLISNCTIVGNELGPYADAAISFAGDCSIIQCIISHSTGFGLKRISGGLLEVSCCDFFANEAGNYAEGIPDQTGINGNISEDPLYCDLGERNFSLFQDSPCLPSGNECNVLMGALGKGCTLTGLGDDSSYPSDGKAEQNFPNPFNPDSEIPFELSAGSSVRISVYDTNGSVVRELVHDRFYAPGRHSVTWDGRLGSGEAAPSGVYYYRIENGSTVLVNKMVLLK